MWSGPLLALAFLQLRRLTVNCLRSHERCGVIRIPDGLAWCYRRAARPHYPSATARRRAAYTATTPALWCCVTSSVVSPRRSATVASFSSR